MHAGSLSHCHDLAIINVVVTPTMTRQNDMKKPIEDTGHVLTGNLWWNQ